MRRRVRSPGRHLDQHRRACPPRRHHRAQGPHHRPRGVRYPLSRADAASASLRPGRDRVVPDGAAAQGGARDPRTGGGARVAARPRGPLRRRHRRGHPRAARRQSQSARARARLMSRSTRDMSSPDLLAFAGAIARGDIEVIDLTHTLTPEFPTIAMPPELGQCAPFRMEEVSRYDERGPAWYWNNISMGEHTVTHFDAPIHWISGKDLPNRRVDTIPVANFIASAAVIDVSAQSAANPDYELTVADVEAWERRHSRI